MGRKYGDVYVTRMDVDAVWAALPGAVQACGFEVTSSSESERTLSAKKRMRNSSTKQLGPANASRSAHATFGEKLEASVGSDGTRSRVVLESRLIFGLIDWGENQRNVSNIRRELDARLAPT